MLEIPVPTNEYWNRSLLLEGQDKKNNDTSQLFGYVLIYKANTHLRS